MPNVRRVIESLPLLRGLSLRPEACQLVLHREPSADSAPIFILIHGTWSSSRGWSERRAQLIHAIERLRPSAGIYFFDWGATNGIRHRLMAAERLASVLDDVQARYNQASIYTIAHSHGGNVAAWAAARTKCTQSGAVYYNTPFMHIVRPSKERMTLLRILLLMLTVLAVVPLLTGLGDAADHGWRPTVRSLLGGLPFIGMLFAFVKVPKETLKNLL